jgi:hypothetical protein
MEAERLLLHFVLTVASMRRWQQTVAEGSLSVDPEDLARAEQEVDDLVRLHLLPARPDPYVTIDQEGM